MYHFFTFGDASTPFEFAPFPHLSSTEPEFRQQIVTLAASLGVDPNHLAGVMSFESQFSPFARNRYTGAIGLIQFLRKTATSLGTSLQDLKKMTRVEQMKYVGKHYAPYARRMKRPQDVYLAVFSPKYIGASDDVVMAREGSNAYAWNKSAFDKSNKGFYTVGDVTKTFLAHLSQYAGLPHRVKSTDNPTPETGLFQPDDRLDFSGKEPFEWEKLFFAVVVSGALLYGYTSFKSPAARQPSRRPAYRLQKA